MKNLSILFLLMLSVHLHAMELVKLDPYHRKQYLMQEVLAKTINNDIGETPENNNFIQTCQEFHQLIVEQKGDDNHDEDILKAYPKTQSYLEQLINITNEDSQCCQKLCHAFCANPQEKKAALDDWLKTVRYVHALFLEKNTSLTFPTVPGTKSKVLIPEGVNLNDIRKISLRANSNYDTKDKDALVAGILMGAMLKQVWHYNLPRKRLDDLPKPDIDFINDYFENMSIKPTLDLAEKIGQNKQNNNLIKAMKKLYDACKKKALYELIHEHPEAFMDAEELWRKAQNDEAINTEYTYALNAPTEYKSEKLNLVFLALCRFQADQWKTKMSMKYRTFNEIQESEQEERAVTIEKQRKLFITDNAFFDLNDRGYYFASHILLAQTKQYFEGMKEAHI